MTPLSFEWQWNSEYFIFMGLLYLALAIIGCGLAFAWIKTWFELDMERGPEGAPEKLSYRSKYGNY